MSTETSMDVNVLEKIGDALAVFSEATGTFLTRLLGSSNERQIRKLGYIRSKNRDRPYTVVPTSILGQVNALEERMHALSPEELKAVDPQAT